MENQNQTQERSYAFNANLVQGIIDYLSTRPFREVVQLINAMSMEVERQNQQFNMMQITGNSKAEKPKLVVDKAMEVEEKVEKDMTCL